MSDRTQKLVVQAVPIRSLRAEVLAGPDRGTVIESENETLTVGTASDNALVLQDPLVSRYHATITATPGGFRVVDLGSTNGSVIHAVRVEAATVGEGSILELGSSRVRLGAGATREAALFPDDKLAGLRGSSPPMRRLMADVVRVAASKVSVLLQGESGTGKEVVARAIHEQSARQAGPFEVVDCGAIVPTLVASELFGHERGAFTGATERHAGSFERARGGTLLLDEVAELPLAVQASLLGALERRRFRRLGGKVEIETDVRVVAATHRDLRTEVNAGRFRQDLYYRLAVVVLPVPPLRERSEDVPMLVEHFLREAGHDGPLFELLSERSLAMLTSHSFPGNVRELRNVTEALLAMGRLPATVGPADDAEGGGKVDTAADDETRWTRPYRVARAEVVEAFEARYARALLERCEGNVSRAAREAQMDRSYLIELVRKHRLKAS